MDDSSRPLLYDECKHDYVHVETIYTDKYDRYNGDPITYIRIDRFYCRHCLKEQEIRKKESAYKKPEWYRSKNDRC